MRDLDQELQQVKDGLRRAYLNRDRTFADCRRRMQDANELIREYRRRMAEAETATGRTSTRKV